MLLHHFDPILFNISLGQALSEFPLVAHALSWLNLDKASLNHHQAALLLQSPYIGSAKEEFIARSHYLQDSALLQENRFSLNTLINDLQPHAPKLACLLEQIATYPAQRFSRAMDTSVSRTLKLSWFPGRLWAEFRKLSMFQSLYSSF